MKSHEFINEDVRQLSWNGNPEIGWWQDQNYLILYHGTHERNVNSILQNGLNRPDPQTGKISMAFEPNTAYGYAAMSGQGGEAEFRQLGVKVKNTPGSERVIFVAKIPMSWIMTNMDKNLGGNLALERKRLTSKEEYENYKATVGNDQSYYQLAELRFNTAIPAKYIVGYMKKL